METQNHLKNFYQALHAYLEGASACKDGEELFVYIQTNFPTVTGEYIEQAELVFMNDANEGNDLNLQAYVLHFAYPDKFKTFCFLNISLALQLAIARQRQLDERITKEEWNSHYEECSQLLQSEGYDLLESFKKEVEYSLTKDEIVKRKLESVKHFSNPWKVYKDQIEQILEQLKQIEAANLHMLHSIKVYQSIGDFVQQIHREVIATNSNFLKQSEECLSLLNNSESPEKFDTILNIIGDMLENGVNKESKTATQTRYLEDIIDKLKTIDLPIEYNEGKLILKNIPYTKLTQKWLDYNTIPYLIDLWDNQEANFSHILQVYSHLKNSVTLAKKAPNPARLAAEINSLEQLIIKQKTFQTESELIVQSIEKSIGPEFKATDVYTDSEFLKVPLQTNYRLGGFQQSSLLSKISENSKKFFSSLTRRYVSDKKENNYHDALEKALEIIELRTHQEQPDHYHSLFLNRNFIGDLFLVKRVTIKAKILDLIEQWNHGNHRSIALVGDPLSGRSTIMDQLAHYFPSSDVIYLKPDDDLVVEGRKTKTTKNLNDALSHIDKSIRSTRPVLLIDDLPFWKDKNISLFENMLSLMEFISSNSSRVMVVITITNSLLVHLNSTVKFSDVFTHLLDANTTSFEKIYKAIMLRHGASHRKLFDKNDKPMSAQQIRKNILALCKSYNNNLGAVLQAWTFCTEPLDGYKVRFTLRDAHFNDFLSPVEMLIIKQSLTFGSSTELQLKNQFATRFEPEFKPAIRKLLNLGILDRNASGSLIVKESVRHDLFVMLKIKELLA